MADEKIAGTQNDPTLASGETTIGDETFRLCFDFAALARAKAILRREGVEFNVLRSLDFGSLDVDTLPALFFAASYRFHPDLTWERAQKLITMRTGGGVMEDLAKAYMAAMAEPQTNPPEAPAS